MPQNPHLLAAKVPLQEGSGESRNESNEKPSLKLVEKPAVEALPTSRSKGKSRSEKREPYFTPVGVAVRKSRATDR